MSKKNNLKENPLLTGIKIIAEGDPISVGLDEIKDIAEKSLAAYEDWKETSRVSTLLDHVLPPDGVLYKNSGLWEYYESDLAFSNQKEYASQTLKETFEDFIERVIKQLMKDEETDEERLVAINYAIHINNP